VRRGASLRIASRCGDASQAERAMSVRAPAVASSFDAHRRPRLAVVIGIATSPIEPRLAAGVNARTAARVFVHLASMPQALADARASGILRASRTT